MSEPKGWICPKCGCVYAPWVDECAKCNGNVLVSEQGETQEQSADYWTDAYGEVMEKIYPQQDREHTVLLDANMQCVDCPYGELKEMDTPDRTGKVTVIMCKVYNAFRDVNDTCIAQNLLFNTDDDV